MKHYGRIGPRCGAFLDPGEHCDCEKESAYQQKSELNMRRTVKTSLEQETVQAYRERMHV